MSWTWKPRSQYLKGTRHHMIATVSGLSKFHRKKCLWILARLYEACDLCIDEDM
jgi:hypothetical protein